MQKHNESHFKDFSCLDEWLYYLEHLHNTEIDLGLSRIGEVAKRLHIDFSFALVITVAGTNGKGTTCAFLENALLDESITGQFTAKQTAVSYSQQTCASKAACTVNSKVAVYSSPHIEHFNERLRINKRDIDDHSLIKAFQAIEIARRDISLSYYEFTTLAAFVVLMSLKPDVIILEVGLGGRLDATNIIDADVAVITSVDIDHQAFLGNDRESIGFEKAGIMRANQHIIIGDPDAPKSVLNFAQQVNAINTPENLPKALNKIKIRNKDFFIKEQTASSNETELDFVWQCMQADDAQQSKAWQLKNLSAPHIPTDNLATALMVLKQLGVSLTCAKVNSLIAQTRVAGRTELFSAKKGQAKGIKLHADVMLDVGHNPHAGRFLAKKLAQYKNQNQNQKKYQRIIAVVAMLVDKDITNTVAPFNDIVDDWYIAPLSVPRAASTEDMLKALTFATNSINCFDNITQAFKIANLNAESTDLILVFGSFYTVAEIRQLLI